MTTFITAYTANQSFCLQLTDNLLYTAFRKPRYSLQFTIGHEGVTTQCGENFLVTFLVTFFHLLQSLL